MVLEAELCDAPVDDSEDEKDPFVLALGCSTLSIWLADLEETPVDESDVKYPCELVRNCATSVSKLEAALEAIPVDESEDFAVLVMS